MAVQKSRKSRSKRNMRRSSNMKCTLPSLTKDIISGEIRVRHFIGVSGFYRGKEVLRKPTKHKIENNT